MAKELIISANLHEKKVAMLEDGVVTEFYVERRDENQGVVGNLYKGRVMKVLPGMQSAFVDIGLERDAFLYVSDFTEFMEEEEEIDFREVGDEARMPPPPRVDDRARRGDRLRPEYQPVGQRPAAEATPDGAPAERPVRPVSMEDAVEQLAEIAVESVLPPPPPEEDLPEQDAQGAPSSHMETFHVERVTDEGSAEPFEEAQPERLEQPAELEPAEGDAKPKRGRGRKAVEPRKKAVKTDEKGAKSTTRKPLPRSGAKRPRRRGDEETDSEIASEAETESAKSQFERVTDEDVAQDAGDLLKDAMVQEKIIERVHTAEFHTVSPQPEPEPEWRVGSLRSLADSGSTFQRVVDENAEAASRIEAQESSHESEHGIIGEQSGEGKGSPFRHISDVVRGLYGRIQSGASGELNDETGGRQSSGSEAGLESSSAETQGEGGDNKKKPSADDDREAEVRERGPRSEFAVRRGGRGRRGRGGRREAPAGAAPIVDDSIAPSVESEEGTARVEEVQAPEDSAPSIETKIEAGPVEPRPTDERPEPRPEARPEARPVETRTPAPGPQRRPDPRRPDSRRPDARRPDPRRPEPGPARRPERSGPPTISELLHEGQEILVQIAKEPIAKKGARITSHIALPGRLIVYMPTVNHIGVSRKIPNEAERIRLKRIVTTLRDREGATGGFIARTACAGHSEQELADDMRYLLRTWAEVRRKAERGRAPSLVHRDLDLVQRILRDQLSEEFTAIRIDNEIEYARIVEFVNRVQPKLVKRVKLYTGGQPILEKYGVQAEIDKAVRPRVWLKSGGYIVINQTEALVAIDVNTGKFVGKSDKLEDTITRTNLEAAKEIVRQVRLRDLGGIIVLDLIDMEERKNRQKVMMALQQELSHDRSPSKILSINDFGLVAITRKRVKQSLERTLCAPCPYCQGAGMVKSAQTMCFEILEQAKAISKQLVGESDVMLRVSPHVGEALRSTEREVMEEIEAYFGTPVTIEPDPNLHQEQFDFAVV
jgi:Rne/Rng family ribonuclease